MLNKCYIVEGNPWNFLPVSKGVWELGEDIYYRLEYSNGNEQTIMIEKGYKYDLASVPKIFQPLLGKKEKLAVEACLLHDYAYEYHILDRKTADLVFLRLMEYYKNPASGWKRWAMYNAVKWFGGNPYKKQAGRNRIT